MADGQPSQKEGGWVPVPDPTTLTTEAVARATEVFRREIAALHELHDKDLTAFRELLAARLAGMDLDRGRLWDRARELTAEFDATLTRFRDEVERRDLANRALLEQRLTDLDNARLLANEHLTETVAASRADRERITADAEARLAAEREYILAQVATVSAVMTEKFAGVDDRIGEAGATVDTLATGLRELIEQRLNAMDLATKVLAGSVEKFPTDIDRAVGSVREIVLGEVSRVQAVTLEKFTAIDGTFSSNALALTAALAAQKEAAAEQNKSNTLAITKSESSTKETIAANAVQAQTGLASLENQFDDIKERVVRIESAGAGRTSVTGSPFDAAALAQEARIAQEARQRAAMAIVVSSILALVAVASLIFAIVKKLEAGRPLNWYRR
jgi:hypothetical protein